MARPIPQNEIRQMISDVSRDFGYRNEGLKKFPMMSDEKRARKLVKRCSARRERYEEKLRRELGKLQSNVRTQCYIGNDADVKRALKALDKFVRQHAKR